MVENNAVLNIPFQKRKKNAGAYMAGKCVEEQVVGSPCPSCPRDDAARLDDLGVEGYDEVHSWDVLDQHDHRERVVGVVGRGCAHGWYHEPDNHLHYC